MFTRPMQCFTVLLLLLLAVAQVDAIERGELSSEEIGRAVPFAVLIPDVEPAEKLPLVLLLHGAGGDREYVAQLEPSIRELWQSGELPPVVFASASVPAGTIYMDEKSGNAKWESFMMKEFLPHVQRSYPVLASREATIVTGISMGGGGSARFAFKYPDVFGAVAIMEPAIWPGVTWDEVPRRHKFRQPERLAALFGEPFDESYWRANNPASIVADNAARIRDSGLEIYLECGDQDAFGLHEGTEYLHRVLWDNRIEHEYRLVRWADHVGSSVPDRSLNRFRFIARYLAQPMPEEPGVEGLRNYKKTEYRKMGYETLPFWPNEAKRLTSEESSP